MPFMVGTQILVQSWKLRTIFGAVSETRSVVLSVAQARRKAVTVRQQASREENRLHKPFFTCLPEEIQ